MFVECYRTGGPELQLIALYDYVCRCYDTNPDLHSHRQSNNYCPNFTDQELMTIYLFGLIEHRFTLSQTYKYITDHWADWFPRLPSYQAVNYRINTIGEHFLPLIEALVGQIQQQPALIDVRLTDSLPIILSKRPNSARVALDMADKGYCSTKKLYYHGFKLHLIAVDRLQKMPLPERIQFTKASVNDLTALRAELAYLPPGCLVGDKAYASAPLSEGLAAHQQLTLCTPVKLKKGQKRLDAADKGYSTYVSRMRQPIESLFNWFIEKTQIQCGAKIRSEKGALLHCLGRLAAGLYIMLFNS
mgnify:CR=1 FL=1